jgi:hypothetical protein
MIRKILHTSGYDNEDARKQLRAAGLDEELTFKERATLSSAIYANYDVPGSIVHGDVGAPIDTTTSI